MVKTMYQRSLDCRICWIEVLTLRSRAARASIDIACTVRKHDTIVYPFETNCLRYRCVAIRGLESDAQTPFCNFNDLGFIMALVEPKYTMMARSPSLSMIMKHGSMDDSFETLEGSGENKCCLVYILWAPMS